MKKLSFIEEVEKRMAENKIKSANLKKTDSRKGEEFDPVKPTYHLDADNILHENIQFIRHSESLLKKLNKTRQDLVSLQGATSKPSEYEEYDQKIIEIDIKIRLQEEHVEYFQNSLQNAIDIKTEYKT